MKPYKQNPDFLDIGERLIGWYRDNYRELPWRETKDPYKIWISEVVLQQTQVKQGTQHYLNFVGRFPDVKTLADADTDEVLLYWKGLGYYSRALNLHKAARQIVEEFNGEFPEDYHNILKLKGVGKYTAAAVASICFGENIPAVDGNFYRVLSRLFADGTDISSGIAPKHFSEMALRIMPGHSAGDFNQAVMDLGSEICRPRNPQCLFCPVSDVCVACAAGRVHDFPVKTKKVKIENLSLHYYFVQFGDQFLIRRRNADFIWKNLYEFPTNIPESWAGYLIKSTIVAHKLTHRNLSITIDHILLDSKAEFETFSGPHGFTIATMAAAGFKSFPKPLENFLKNLVKIKNDKNIIFAGC